MSGTQLVQSVARAFALLRALNEHNFTTVQELSRITGLPRATVYRLLDTLVSEGYVANGAERKTYRLTIQVRALSEGFADEAWLAEVASPVLRELGQKIVWPTDIATFDRDSMIVRETTLMKSPLSINHGTAGYRPPVLQSALGRAYLAWCPDRERDMILRTISYSARPDAPFARDKAAVDRLLADVRRRGYGFRVGGLEPKTGSIAVPVFKGRRVLACINMHYILSALSEAEVAARYLEPMRAAAADIERAMTMRKRNSAARPGKSARDPAGRHFPADHDASRELRPHRVEGRQVL